MKRMVLTVSVAVALICVSCGNKAGHEIVNADSTTIETIDVIDSVVVDSVYTVAE